MARGEALCPGQRSVASAQGAPGFGEGVFVRLFSAHFRSRREQRKWRLRLLSLLPLFPPVQDFVRREQLRGWRHNADSLTRMKFRTQINPLRHGSNPVDEKKRNS